MAIETEIPIDALNPVESPSRDHAFAVMKDGLAGLMNAGQVVDLAKGEILGGAPAALDTLNELAAALSDDADFAATVMAALAARLSSAANLSDLDDAPTALTNLGLSTYFKTLVGETDAQSLLTTLGGGSQLLQVEEIASPVSTVFFDLPAGYRTFRLSMARLNPTATASLRMTMSFDDGVNYQNSSGNYQWTQIYASRSAGPTKYADNETTTAAYIELLPGSVLSGGNANHCELIINPSEIGKYPSLLMQSHVQSASAGAVTATGSGGYTLGTDRPTNLAIFFSGTTIANAHMRLYGELG